MREHLLDAIDREALGNFDYRSYDFRRGWNAALAFVIALLEAADQAWDDPQESEH